MKKKVVIIGAGVVGLVLGKELGRLGIDVTVYDSKRSVSQGAARASGIFSSTGLSEIGIDYRKSIVNTMNGAVLHGGGEELRVQASETKAFILDRGIFAELCAKEAEGAGAKIMLGKRLTKSELIELAKGNNIIIGADGAVSTVASTFGFPGISEYILTYKAEYENAIVRNIHNVDLFFSNRIAKRFFAWTVPYSKSRLEVGIGISSYSKKNSINAFNDFISTEYMKRVLAGASKRAGYASIIPIELREKTVIGNVLLVGDAAGQVKATTGGGVIFGTSCARVAARSIYNHIENGAPLNNYEKEWRKEYALDLRLHRALHGYYSMLGERGLGFMIKMTKGLGLDGFLAKYGDMDSPRLVLKRFLLRGMSN